VVPGVRVPGRVYIRFPFIFSGVHFLSHLCLSFLVAFVLLLRVFFLFFFIHFQGFPVASVSPLCSPSRLVFFVSCRVCFSPRVSSCFYSSWGVFLITVLIFNLIERPLLSPAL